jgi:hypothetical protein
MNIRVKRIILAILNIAGIILAITVNALANIIPINGKNTGQLSDQYPNLFVPAGLTFAIWGVIYILLIVFAIYNVVILVQKKQDKPAAIEKMGIWFFISCCANAGWIFAWHYELLPLSLLVMLVLLASLIICYLSLRIGKSDAETGERYCIHSAISVYLGWITVATIANVTALLVSIRWNGFGLSDQFWTILVIAAAIVIGLLALILRKDPFFPLVVDWALLGILTKRLANDPHSVIGIIGLVISGMVLLTIGTGIQMIRRKIY